MCINKTTVKGILGQKKLVLLAHASKWEVKQSLLSCRTPDTITNTGMGQDAKILGCTTV